MERGRRVGLKKLNRAAHTTHRAVDILEKLGVDYAITGMVAGAVHGYIRATSDVDIVLAVDKEGWEETLREFLKQGFSFRGERFDKLGIATLKSPNCFGVDLAIEEDDEVFRRGIEAEHHGRTLVFVSLEDLIRHKLRFRRGKDVLDLRELLDANEGNIDWDYLNKKVADPEERDMLDRLRSGEEIAVKVERGASRTFCEKESGRRKR